MQDTQSHTPGHAYQICIYLLHHTLEIQTRLLPCMETVLENHFQTLTTENAQVIFKPNKITHKYRDRQIDTCMYTEIHNHKHRRRQTYTHIHTQSQMQTETDRHMHVHTHTQMHNHKHRQTQNWPVSHTRSCLQKLVSVWDHSDGYLSSNNTIVMQKRIYTILQECTQSGGR